MSKINYPYYNEGISVENLLLDKNNPRLPDYLQGGLDEAKIIEHMLSEESTLELMQAIGEKGFFPGEMLLVVKDSGDKYTVIEGNRRLTAVKLLNNPNAPIQDSLVKKIANNANKHLLPINSLPCMVFEHAEDIHDYLGYRHVTGVQPWNLRQKAKYLSYLRDKNYGDLNLNEASDELRKIIGSKRPVVKRYLVGYNIYSIIKDNSFFKIKDLSEEDFYFSYIADSLSRSNISSYLGVDMDSDNPIENLNLDHLKNWTTWLYQPIESSTGRTVKKTRLKGKSDDLNKLNAILGKESAKKIFVNNDATLEEAYSYTEEFEEVFKNSIHDSIQSLRKANGVVYKLDNFYENIEDDLREIIKLSRNIKSSIDELTKNDFSGDEFGE